MLNAQSNNNAIPDSAASYWLQPLVAGKDTRIVISGAYPDARYASLSVYTPGGSPFTTNGVNSSLTDYQIRPDPGSQNPWQQHADPGGRFTVTIRSDASPGQTNTLPMPAGTTDQHPGYLLYRLYLPADGAHVPLPTLSVQDGNTQHALPPCPQHNSPAPTPVISKSGSASAAASAPPPLQFYKPNPSTFNSGLPNTDTAYVWAYLVSPPASDVVVMTAQAPTFAPGDHPSPWPAAGEDMRYWSICIAEGIQHLPTVANNLPGGQTDYGCRSDETTKHNTTGGYTYVIGTEAQRATIERLPGVTFLPLSTDTSVKLYLLLFRNTLVSPGFPYSVQSITQASDPAAAAAAMGTYYPRLARCPLTTLTTEGPQACHA